MATGPHGLRIMLGSLTIFVKQWYIVFGSVDSLHSTRPWPDTSLRGQRSLTMKKRRKLEQGGSGTPSGATASVVEVTRRVSHFTRLLLFVRAGGRCEFDGCNKFLLEHPLTITEGNFAQMAHIVAL